MSPRRLGGYEPEVRLIPDGDGGFTVAREPEFSRDDLALMLAAQQLTLETTPNGNLIEEELSEDGNPKSWTRQWDWKVEHRVNYAEAAKAKARAEYAKRHEDADLSGHIWSVKKVLLEEEG